MALISWASQAVGAPVVGVLVLVVLAALYLWSRR